MNKTIKILISKRLLKIYKGYLEVSNSFVEKVEFKIKYIM